MATRALLYVHSDKHKSVDPFFQFKKKSFLIIHPI